MAQEFPTPESPVQQFPAPGPAPLPPKKSNAALWIILVLVLVLLCCLCLAGLGIMLWQNGDQWFNLTRLLAPFTTLA